MEMYLQRKEYENMTNGKKGSKLQSHEVRVVEGVQRHWNCGVRGYPRDLQCRGM